ncbi:MAG: beta-ketoacyl-ACP synthase II [Gammaproteobacteria bacterium]|nr:beta-ketoacyl-ACP synthase II [Gammaproteobacteria bacterium]MBT3858850.1 beta-ketoacyl-ACP synthase II [Gammaproteobacteria bacterium]MBT3986201.1 beta-ketoacyl-ACP synthase II [Gammaproteobacteria bacterium]MBT4581367.1 beta-ketoacyl-ACP synthase II [Gammaproteobacteria bacterium]MBT4659125.1 beta-ketoacyl-ACP synthase II [Gammaproteobacteria bacterium]
MSSRRVVVTGLGLITPVGNDVDSAWSALKNGQSGINAIEHFDTSEFSTQFGGSIKNFDCTDYMLAKEARRMDVFMHYGVAAGVQAFQDSGLEDSSLNLERAGVAIGSGIGGISSIEENALLIRDSGPRKVSPFFVPGSIINMIGGSLSIRFGLQGPNIAVTTACTTGTHNIGLAANMISANQADVMLAGGAEGATTPVGLGGFCAARALSKRNDDPQKASRPWDKDRDGFVLSDGAGVMVLEEYEHARARGATIYAELTGFGMSGDAYHMTSPSEGGTGAALCMRNALLSANMNPEDVDYVNAHGTSTIAGDVAETNAIKLVFGDHAKKLSVGSSKSMIGHLLGASGAVEAVISVLSLRDQVVSPTINLDNPDEACDLDYVPHDSRDQELNVVLSNSFGFGGTNGSLIFSKTD